MSDEPATDRRQLPSALTILVGAAGLVILMAGINAVGSIIAPVFFALTLVISGRPLHNWLVRHKVPRLISAILVMLLLYLLLLSIVGGLGFGIAQLTMELPRYSMTFTQIWSNLLIWLSSFGLDSNELINQTMASIDVNRIVGVLNTLLASLSSVGSQVLFLVIMVFFLAFDTQDVRGRLQILKKAQPHFYDAMVTFSRAVRKYWVVSTVFGLIVAVLDVVALAFIGVPLVWTWGILSFVTNYIPNIGFVLGLIPPALMALLVLGPIEMVWVIVAYSVINFVLQTLIQPKFTGDAVGLNASVTFLSLAFWAIVLGPLGALLAVPMTLFLKALIVDSDPKLAWLNVFLKNEDPKPRKNRLARRARPVAR